MLTFGHTTRPYHVSIEYGRALSFAAVSGHHQRRNRGKVVAAIISSLSLNRVLIARRTVEANEMMQRLDTVCIL